MVREVAPVGCIEEHDVRSEAWGETPHAVGPSEDVRRVHRARGERLGRREPKLRARERADEREALAERAPRVEVGRERDRGAGVDERAAGRHRPAEEERAHGEQHADDVGARERGRALGSGRLEMVDGACPELDRERNGTRLAELVAVEAQCEPGVATRLEVATRLRRVERTALEEDVRRLRDSRRFGQDLGEREVEVRLGVVELGWNGVRAEPGRDAARRL